MITLSAEIEVITENGNIEIIKIDRHNIISASRSIFDRSDLKYPCFGIISNNGKIEFNDYDGKIADYAERLLLQKGLRCVLYLNNTLTKLTLKLGEFITSDWNYDNDNAVTTVEVKDKLEQWQGINIIGKNYSIEEELTDLNLAYFYRKLRDQTFYNMLEFDELDSKTQSILSNTYIKEPILESGNLWSQWTKLCVASQCHIYQNSNGQIVFKYNEGN